MATGPIGTVQEPRLGFGLATVAFLLALYLLAIAIVDLLGIYEVLIGNLATLARWGLGLPSDPASMADLRIALLSMFGASLGACLVSFLGLFHYAVLRAEFNARFVGSYLIGPVAVTFLGFGSFVMARTGLFVFGNIQDVSKLTATNELSFLAFGILVGFAWNQVLAKLSEIAAQLFASGNQAVPTRLPPRERPAVAAETRDAEPDRPDQSEADVASPRVTAQRPMTAQR